MTKFEVPVNDKTRYRKCPCQGCTEETGRSITCHSECEKYIEWHKKLEEIRKLRYDEVQNNYIAYNFKSEMIQKAMKKSATRF